MQRRELPRARAIDDFAIENVGNDLVLFDPSRSTYHTLNSVARSIWIACDGRRKFEDIGQQTGMPLDEVEATLAELDVAGLMECAGLGIDRRDLLLRARRVGMVGAVVPFVVSISAPDSASAATTCNYSGQCPSGCCQNVQTLYNCANAVRGTIGWNNVTQQQAEEACFPVAGGSDFCTHVQTLHVTFDGVNIPFSNACK